jgi:quercetin dioxygenase-like cupin family protein
VWAAPGEEHWHGATAESTLVHHSAAIAGVNWLEEVTEEDYERAHSGV